jgi:branched-subunit amino acid transport protein
MTAPDLPLDLTIAGLAVVTVLSRSLFLVFGDWLRLPAPVLQGLRYAPVCALVALIVPQVLAQGPEAGVSLLSPKVGAAIVAVAVMRWRRDMLAAMAAGMLALFLLRWIA